MIVLGIATATQTNRTDIVILLTEALDASVNSHM